jgi:hypothetical protein
VLVEALRYALSFAEIIGRLNGATIQASADPAVQSRLANLGVEIFPTERQTPEFVDALVKADAEKWWPLIKEFGIKAEWPRCPVRSSSVVVCLRKQKG